MTELEDDVQCALALLQTSIKKYGPQDTLVVGCKKCMPITQALRGHKFLKENGYVTAAVRVGTFVTEPYRSLAEVLEIIKKEYNVTLQMSLFAVSGQTKRGRRSKRGRAPLSAPRTRIRVKRSAEVVQVSSSSEEQSYQEQSYQEQSYQEQSYQEQSSELVEQLVYARDHSGQSASEEQSLDSTEIMNASDLRGDDSEEESSSVTGVNRRSAEQSSASSRFVLHEQRFVNGFSARHAQQGDIMMTIKLFGATVPVPANTIVFQPWRDLEHDPDADD